MGGNFLIGLDESAYSGSAVDLGIRLARRSGAVLVGLGIVDEPTICKPEPVPIGGTYYKRSRDEALVADARRRVRGILERFAARCTAAGVAFRLLEETGLPCERILAESENFDLTLLGKRTYFHFETRSSADNTLPAVVRRSKRPVVAVPLEPPASNAVVVAYDAGPASVRALHAFRESGLADGQAVHVLSIARDARLAERRAQEALQLLCSHGIDARARALPQTAPPAGLILREVKTMGAGMLVMGAYGRSRYSEFFFGSTTRTLVRESETLLFLHH